MLQLLGMGEDEHVRLIDELVIEGRLPGRLLYCAQPGSNDFLRVMVKMMPRRDDERERVRLLQKLAVCNRVTRADSRQRA